MTPCRNHPYSDTSTPWTLSLKPLESTDTSKLSSSSENCTLAACPIKSSHYYFLPFHFFLPILLTQYTNNKSFTLFPVLHLMQYRCQRLGHCISRQCQTAIGRSDVQAELKPLLRLWVTTSGFDSGVSLVAWSYIHL